jgi:serine protease AprX
VLELAAVHGVRRIRQKVLPRTSNNVAAGILHTGYAWAAAPRGLGLSGQGETIAVCDTGLDTGDADTVHRDFRGRVDAILSYPITPYWSRWIDNPEGNDGAADLDTGHGTHVAGSVLGNGMQSLRDAVRIQGSAPKARLVFQAVEQEMRWKRNAPPDYRDERYLLSGIPDDASVLLRDAYNRGARIHSDSWGGGDPGAYDEQCRLFDDFVWKRKAMCVVVAAGNDGTDADGDGRIDTGSVASPGTAKNCITVGASENLRREFDAQTYGRWWPRDYPAAPYRDAPMADNPEQVVAFSSRGPTLDGRVKPEVVAPGTFVLSTRSTRIAENNHAWGAHTPNNAYMHMGGTSMATPLVAGAVALLREYLRKRQRIATPSAALLKALLVAGVRRLPGRAGVLFDDDQGFGRVDLERSLGRVLYVVHGRKLATGELSTHRIDVPATSKTLRVVMAYTDAPGPELVNNLNLLVQDPGGFRYLGNVSRQQALMTLDNRNNLEAVEAPGKRGTWQLSVAASNVREGPQDFALAVVLV